MNELVITKHGLKIKKKKERFSVSGEDTQKEVPAADLGIIIVIGNVDITSSAIRLANEYNIPIHITDQFGNPLSTIYSSNLAGNPRLKIKQLEFRNESRSTDLAKKFAKATLTNRGNMLKSLSRTRDISGIKEGGEEILGLRKELKEVRGDLGSEVRETIMNIEGRGGKTYYRSLEKIIPDEIYEGKRKKRPPGDCFNAALSYGYGILYSRVNKSVIFAGLNPYLSFLHAEYSRRPGLVMDLIEEFRQPVVDRAIINLSIRGQLSCEDVETTTNGVLLNERGRKKVADEVLNKLSTPTEHRGIKTPVKRHIKNQSILLANHIMGEKVYEPYTPRRM